MCGIVGLSNGGDAVLAQSAVGEALNYIRHRGPDSHGLTRFKGGAMGMRRLAIVDVAHGAQPVFSEDGRFCAVFNGEIYNYLDLAADLRSRGHKLASNSDSEIIPHLYEEYGTAMFALLDGMFSIAVADVRTGSLVLARDRFGKKPLYYTRLPGGGLAFASELKAIRPMVEKLGGRLSISDQAIYDFLSLGVVPQPRTIFSGVTAVSPASFFKFDSGVVSTETYWAPRFSPKSDISFSEGLRLTRTAISSATKKRLHADVPVGVFLSGGVDSSVVAYEVSRAALNDIDTFTVKMADEALDESSIAVRTARSLGLPNHVLELSMDPVELVPRLVSHYDQPYADSSAIPSMEISRLASAHVKVVLNGDGGDEIFGGYRRHFAARQIGRLGVLPAPVKRLLSETSTEGHGSSRRSAVGLLSRFRRGLAMDAPERYLAWTTDMLRERDKVGHWQGGAVDPTEDLVASLVDSDLGGLDQQISLDLKLNLLSDLLVKMDMATMLHSIEGRSPFLDHHVAEFAFSMPDSFKVRGRRTKAILKSAYRDLIPDEVLRAPKRGFEIPMASWLSNELKPMVMDTVMTPNSMISDYVDGEFVRGIVQGSILPERNTSYLVFSLLVLELWLRGQRVSQT